MMAPNMNGVLPELCNVPNLSSYVKRINKKCFLIHRAQKANVLCKEIQNNPNAKETYFGVAKFCSPTSLYLIK